MVYAGDGGDGAAGTRAPEAAGPTASVGRGCTVALAMTTCSASTARIGQTGPNVLLGGTGKDVLEGHRGGRLYGGPGNDLLTDELGSGESDMLVGGPGRDIVKLFDDQRTDVVRLRNGGADHVICLTSATDDVLFVDRIDRLGPGCKSATVLYTERPRYPYP